MYFIIIICTLLIGSSFTTSVREYNDINIIDDAYFYPNEGIYLEPAGQYLQYSGSIAIPFVYSLPTLTIKTEEYCSGHESIWKMHDIALNHIKDIVTPFSSHNIKYKRSLFPIAAIISGGLSVWNTIELKGIKNNLLWMNQNSLHINKAVSTLTDSQHIIINNVKTLIGLIGDHSRLLHQIINSTECSERNENLLQSFVSNWLYFAPMEFISAYSGAITGRVTPELLSARNLKNVLSTHFEMKNTIYEYEPESVYEFGQIILTEVVVDSNAFLKGIIQLPKILAISPTPMYNIYTVNTILNGYDHKYNFPSTLICTNPKNCWDVDRSMCILKTHRLICLYGAKTIPNNCLYNLHKNTTKECSITIREHTSPFVAQTKSGILFGGSKSNYHMYKRSGDIDIISSSINPSLSAQMLQNKDGDWITVNGSIYSTKIVGFDYKFATIITSSNSSINNIDYSLATPNWKDMQELSFKPLNLADYNYYFLIFPVLISIGTLISFVIFLFVYKSVKDKHCGKVSIPLIGLR